jgi:hypothetical protein
MTYFSKLPLIPYSVDSGRTFKVVSDILRRVSVNQQTKENYAIYEEYTIQDGETPESVSFKLYGDPQYHWVVMLLNDIIDPRYDWPLTDTQLFDFVDTKYSGNISGVKYHTLSADDDTVVDSTQLTINREVDEFGTGIVVGTELTYPSAYPITNLAYESKLNEEKRTIRVLRPKLLSAFVSEFEALING